MRGKNGFIATSVLYSFLLAFLTLFLAYVANYLQNKLLLNRVENLAQEELETYGNMSVYDMEVGDYAIFDTLDDELIEGSSTVGYSSPINPNSRWILFKTEEDTDNEDLVNYYFVSDINAQKDSFVVGCNLNESGSCSSYFNDSNQAYDETLRDYKAVPSSLSTISGIINGNLFYRSASSAYKTYSDSNATTDVEHSENEEEFVRFYEYAFALREYVPAIKLSILSDNDLTDIVGILNDNIKNAILDQNYEYVFWDTQSSSGGFVIYDKTMFSNGSYSGYNDGTNISVINGYCGSVTGNEPASYVGSSIAYNSTTYSFGHVMSTYVDYCYHATTFIGSCKSYDDSSKTADYWNLLTQNDKWSKCNQTSNGVSPRFVLKITISKEDASTHVYADSGNGTKQYPYMITKGEKRDL